MARSGRHKATSYELTKISAWVGADDWAFLQSRHRYAASDVLRRLIHEYRLKVETPRAWRDATALDLSGL